MIVRMLYKRNQGTLLSVMLFCTGAIGAGAHPHVFVDGGIDFVVEKNTVLTALDVTWLFDEFETLYLLSSTGVVLSDDNRLPSSAWSALKTEIGSWPDSFSGSAHLSVAGQKVALSDPTDFEVRMVEQRLELTFQRKLTEPLALSDVAVEAAFFEASYFYDFTVTQPPVFNGEADDCAAEVVPFVANDDLSGLQTKLAALSREELPDNPNVGALFADRIEIQCAQ